MARQTFKFNGHLIGPDQPVYMIAEIGINHNGSLDNAKRLIDAAFACGWNCVKFQKRSPDICVPDKQKGVIRDTPWGKMTYLEYRKKVEFGRQEYDYIDTYCREKPLDWTASVWDLPSLEFILAYGVSFIKIPSAKANDAALVREAARSGKTVILSTGMSTMEEVELAVGILDKHSGGNYILMHTNSAYPSPPEDLNLNVIPALRRRFGCVVGYSGHEYDLEPSVIAATLGARLIERHITLDHGMWGTDHFASLEVNAMDMLRKRLKNIDAILGDGVKRVAPSEVAVREKLRGDR